MDVLQQLFADQLLKMPKVKTDDILYTVRAGDSLEIPLTSEDGREEFILGITRGKIVIKKASFNNRYGKIHTLARLDVGGQPHRNPDGVKVPSPHLHLYREGFGDKWAYPVDAAIFTDTANLTLTLEQFMNFCNVKLKPTIQYSF